MEKRLVAHICLAIVQLDYGVFHVLTKFALNDGANQVALCVYRDFLGLFILGLAAFIYDRKNRNRPPVTPWMMFQFFVLGLTGIFGNQLLFMLGLKLTSPSYASAVQPAIPVFTFLLALANGTESLNWQGYDSFAKVGGIVLSVSGAVLMAVYQGPLLFGHTEGLNGGVPWLQNASKATGLDPFRLGILCLIANCFLMAVYIAYQAPILAKYAYGLIITAYSYFFGTILMVLTGYLTVSNISDWTITQSEGYAIAFAGVFSSALNYGLLTWSNSIVGPSLVALYMPLQPLFSSTLASVFLHSPLFLGSILGGVLIISGLLSVTWGKSESARLLSLEEDNRKALLSEA